MSKIFFISDTHFCHTNILKYENRPFNSVEEMNTSLVNKWNNKVSKTDEVYILGDFSFGNEEETLSILNKLNGQKYLILGNHDHVVKKSKSVRDKFAWVKDYYMLKLKTHNLKIVMMHYPLAVWDCKHHGAIHLYGHIHSNIGNHSLEKEELNSFNVGVDVNNFEPISLDEILEKLKNN